MTTPMRLRALPEKDTLGVRFQVEFADSDSEIAGRCAEAVLETGDGLEKDVGLLCAPTDITWRSQRTLTLLTHEYADTGPYTATLQWGDISLSTTVEPGTTFEALTVERPELPLFALQHLKQKPLQVVVNLKVRRLQAGRRLRVEGGDGQVLWVEGNGGKEQAAEATWNYGKPGTYQVGIDLVDEEGFWLATLAESPLEVTYVVEEPVPSEEPTEDIPVVPYIEPPEDVHILQQQPWLPFRYARPMWSGVLTYTAPGGGVVSRSLGWGTYVSIKGEALVGGNIWYRTGGGDWIAGSSVSLLSTSELRGAPLGTSPQPPQPPTPPEPPPPGPPPSPPPGPEEPLGRGRVTATLLNVRARPGVAPDNPPVERLRIGTEVNIYEEQLAGGATWYRIGADRWVHSGWVEWISGPKPTPPAPEPGEPIGEGTVIADGLNVRARPGVRPDNPPIDQLDRGSVVQIFERDTYDGEEWYRIGVGRWVHGGWVEWIGEPEEPPAPPSPGPEEPSDEPLAQGVVTTGRLNVRAQPGVRADNPPVAQLSRGATVDIYEERTYEGSIWYRIGVNRWVHSGFVQKVGEAEPEPTPTKPLARGVVTASLLNVRAQPGIGADNPPVDHLWSGTEVDIYEERDAAGDVWYRIGEDRWVHGGWVRVLQRFDLAVGSPTDIVTAATAPAAIAAEPFALPVGWVSTQSLNVRSRPGTAPENPPVDTVYHNQLVRILEEQRADGAVWYRIGEDRWVHGGMVAAARFKARPSSIGPSERWVGVSLRDQTAVAYEGDRPVYAAMVASGLPGTPTVQGIFRTWSRVPSGRMVGPGYYLEDVTWTCYFYSGYSLHTAYWHDAFGAPRSHGCVNLSPYDAWWIFQWSAPGGSKSPTVYVYWA